MSNHSDFFDEIFPSDFGPRLIVSPHVSDFRIVKRTWKERLFTLPWQPFVSTRTVPNSTFISLHGSYIVSPRTYAQIKAKMHAKLFGEFL